MKKQHSLVLVRKKHLERYFWMRKSAILAPKRRNVSTLYQKLHLEENLFMEKRKMFRKNAKFLHFYGIRFCAWQNSLNYMRICFRVFEENYANDCFGWFSLITLAELETFVFFLSVFLAVFPLFIFHLFFPLPNRSRTRLEELIY